MATATVAWIPLVAATLLLGCSKPAPPAEQKPTPPPKPATVVPATPAEQAQDIFSKRCVVCHGDHGMGDGPGAAALQPKPRIFSDATWQAATTDEHIGKTIVAGG